MDDLEFRRHIYADPSSKNADVAQAKLLDPAKKQFAQDVNKLDQKIKQAMEIPIPDDLYNKLMLKQTLASHQQKKRKSRFHLAMAASVAFAVAITYNFMHTFSISTSDYALTHVYHEMGDFDNNSSPNISLAAINEKLSDYDGVFNQSVGKFISADYCYFDGIKSLHLVLQGKTSPVTIFVTPRDNSLAFDEHFGDELLQGFSKRYANAEIIVVADKNESLDYWQKNIKQNMQWSI